MFNKVTPSHRRIVINELGDEVTKDHVYTNTALEHTIAKQSKRIAKQSKRIAELEEELRTREEKENISDGFYFLNDHIVAVRDENGLIRAQRVWEEGDTHNVSSWIMDIEDPVAYPCIVSFKRWWSGSVGVIVVHVEHSTLDDYRKLLTVAEGWE